MSRYNSLTLFILCCFCQISNAQTSYTDSISAFRKNYKDDLIKETRSPLKENDTSFLRFYPAKKEYKVMATITEITANTDFVMETHSGKKQAYKQFAVATFILKGKKHQLHLYRNISLLSKEEHKNHLFLPFNDLTNAEATFGGGRYIDLSLEDIKDGKIIIDFNKCYNPYCAFKGGYSCPIPPSENRLNIKIEAGEKLFGKATLE